MYPSHNNLAAGPYRVTGWSGWSNDRPNVTNSSRPRYPEHTSSQRKDHVQDTQSVAANSGSGGRELSRKQVLDFATVFEGIGGIVERGGIRQGRL